MINTLEIAKFSQNVSVVAHPSFLSIESVDGLDLTNIDNWISLTDLSQEGLVFSQKLKQLIEQDIIKIQKTSFVIQYEDWPKLLQIEYDFLDGLVPWAPFSISITSDGSIGSDTFKLSYSFILGRNQKFPIRVGPFLKRGNALYRLSPVNYEIIETIDSFNELPVKNKEATLTVIEKIKRLSNVKYLDDYLNSETVIIPSKVSVDIDFDDNGLISLFPHFEGIPAESFKKEYYRFSNIQTVYDVESEYGKRIRVIISDEIKQILSQMQKIRHVGGTLKDHVLANVLDCFEDGIDKDLIDLSLYSPRVRGIGDAPQRAKVIIKSKNRDWADTSAVNQIIESISLRLTGQDFQKDINITSNPELEDLKQAVFYAKQEEQSTIDFKGNKIYLDDDLIGGLNDASKIFENNKTDNSDSPKKLFSRITNSRYLLIYSNEEATEYNEGNLEIPFHNQLDQAIIPKSLNQKKVSLKKHQIDGIKWLQNLFENRAYRRGCLLADDMGLGKTLQILAFLAWCIEEGYADCLGQDTGPYEPILIVAPLILLQNWKDEIGNYFKDDIFEPVLLLHDKKLKELSRSGPLGKETALGSPRLNIKKILDHRVIITNYDTVKNYQHSFARIPWSIIVTDEAQEFKEQNARSDALKSLRAQFKIVATGTPVENRLLDLWNLVDYMQPGSILGSSKEFSDRYEKNILDKSDDERKEESLHLRKKLLYERSDSLILRREKKNELLDLPKKIEVTQHSKGSVNVKCFLSDIQRELHIELVKGLSDSENKQHHFKILHALRKLYLHPALLEGPKPITNPELLISSCPKLKKVIEILESVKSKREKVLIFTVSQDMQTILKYVLDQHFQLDIDIINGAPDSKRQGQMEHRKSLIQKFSNSNGFNILILSPRVAGVGLTITAANHVVHYERWWNPAKESQATDRAYRIGQNKDVYVYYPVALDPKNEFITFDQKLDELLEYKKGLAADFLVPSNFAEVSPDEILSTFLSSENILDEDKVTVTSITDLNGAKDLNGHSFECLVAILYKKMGYSIVLGPLSGDGGADVVAVSHNQILLIQCKHTTTSFPISSTVISDLQDASGHYRSQIFSDKLRRLSVSLMGITNGSFDHEAKAFAVQDDIKLFESNYLLELLQKYPVKKRELISAEELRAKSLDDLRQRLAIME